MKLALKWKRYKHADDTIAETMKELKEISKDGFQECFQNFHEHWQKCVGAEGNYYEGNTNVKHFSERTLYEIN